MKLIIIEDRIERLKSFVEFELEMWPEVHVVTGVGFDNLLSELRNNNTHLLDRYKCIASHRSALSNEIRDILKEYCSRTGKPLIFFSGGISTSVFKDSSFPFLHINSKEFYSENLKVFLEDLRSKDNVNLLTIQFGERWKMNLLLKLRNDITVSLNNGTIKRVNDLKINSLIRDEILNEKSPSFLKGNQFASVNAAQVNELRATIGRLINDLI